MAKKKKGIISPIIMSAAAELPIVPLEKKYTGTPTTPAMEKHISCRLVKLKATLVLTFVKSLGTGT